MSGIVTSSRMRSGLSAALACSSALAPLVATLVRYWSFRMASAAAMLAGVSSTIRMVLSGIMCSFPLSLQLEMMLIISTCYRHPAKALTFAHKSASDNQAHLRIVHERRLLRFARNDNVVIARSAATKQSRPRLVPAGSAGGEATDPDQGGVEVEIADLTEECARLLRA